MTTHYKMDFGKLTFEEVWELSKTDLDAVEELVKRQQEHQERTIAEGAGIIADFFPPSLGIRKEDLMPLIRQIIANWEAAKPFAP